MKAGKVVDATLIAAPSSTKNKNGQRDLEMHQSNKGNQWFSGMSGHIGVDAALALVHTVRATAGNVNDVVEASSLLCGRRLSLDPMGVLRKAVVCSIITIGIDLPGLLRRRARVV